MTSKYRYGNDELVFSVPLDGSDFSDFDREVIAQWTKRLDENLFRYKISGPDSLPTRTTSGPLRLVLQLNPNRSSARRRPETITTMRQPFDDNSFQFLKIRPGEIMAKMACLDDEEGTGDNLLIVNVSPLEFGHSLFVPDVSARWTQIFHRSSHLRQALGLALLSSSPNFRLCYNSLCGLASVNHLHFHVYYLQARLAIETASVQPIENVLSLIHVLDDVGQTATCRGFAFQILCPEDVSPVCDTILKLTGRFMERDVAYNLFATRGTPFRENNSLSPSSPSSYAALRIFLWPRRKYIGAKSTVGQSESSFNVAACELAGHLIVNNETAFDTLTEESAMEVMRDVAVDDTVWNDLLTFAKDL